jgi:hypothetical protein
MDPIPKPNRESSSLKPVSLPRRHRGSLPRQRQSVGESRSSGSALRRRGGQPGNHNALKHGFYSRAFHKVDLTDLDASDLSGLLDEIKLLRVSLRQLVDYGRCVETFSEALAFMRMLCLAGATLNRLIKTQKFLATGKDEVSVALNETLDQLAQDPRFPILRGFKPLDPPEGEE